MPRPPLPLLLPLALATPLLLHPPAARAEPPPVANAPYLPGFDAAIGAPTAPPATRRRANTSPGTRRPSRRRPPTRPAHRIRLRLRLHAGRRPGRRPAAGRPGAGSPRPRRNPPHQPLGPAVPDPRPIRRPGGEARSKPPAPPSAPAISPPPPRSSPAPCRSCSRKTTPRRPTRRSACPPRRPATLTQEEARPCASRWSCRWKTGAPAPPPPAPRRKTASTPSPPTNSATTRSRLSPSPPWRPIGCSSPPRSPSPSRAAR